MRERLIRNRRPTSTASLASSHRWAGVRQALYLEDLARAHHQTPREKLKLALELSELCWKLKRAIHTAETGHEKS